MAINKAKTSPIVKIGSIFLILAFVLSLITVNAASCSSSQQQGAAQQPNANTVAGVAAAKDPGLKVLQDSVRSEPTSYTALVNLGNYYLDYASALNDTVPQGAQPSAEVLQKQSQLYEGARDVYGAAIKIKFDDPGLGGDYAIALFNTGDTEGALKIAKDTVKKFPDAAIVWLKLGDFNGLLAQNSAPATGTVDYKADAISAYEKYLKLDPAGQYASFAKDQIKTLKSGATPVPQAAPNQ